MSTSKFDQYIYCPWCSQKLSLQKIENEEVKKCTACGFIEWNNPKPVASILIHQNKKVLMLQRANEPFENYWVLPGGYINHQETAQDAAKREAREETELVATIEGILGAYRIDNDPRGVAIDIIFYGAAQNNELKLSKEHTQWQFFSKEELPKNIAYKHKDAILDWFKK